MESTPNPDSNKIYPHLVVDEDVSGGQVAVDDLLGGEVGHPLGDLVGERGEVARRQRLALAVQVLVVVLVPRLLEKVLQGAAVDELEDEEDRI